MSTRDEDFVSSVFVCNTHTPVLFFSSRGIVYKLKVYRLPEGNPQARGKALINLLPLEEGGDDHNCHAHAGRRRQLGRAVHLVLNSIRRRPTQPAVRFHQYHGQRQDRYETRRRRSAYRRPDLYRGRGHHAGRRQRKDHPFPSAMSGCSQAARLPVCAASVWRTARRSFP